MGTDNRAEGRVGSGLGGEGSREGLGIELELEGGRIEWGRGRAHRELLLECKESPS